MTDDRRSIEVALTSSAHFLESLLAEVIATDNIAGHRIRLEAALEGVQRAIAYVGGSSSGWRTDTPPRGVRCLVTARGLAGDVGVLIASIMADCDRGDIGWFCNSTRLVEVLAWMPMPEPFVP